ncbi:YALIA101S05e00540g1_1 [Yarrowia lipolytica]|nr:YALIA101S05e00540g1_1 [Yarrowia lipolytica]VBB79313.1 Hypothetical protein conserved in the Yarrowia clade [Yarrowia lipolytica]
MISPVIVIRLDFFAYIRVPDFIRGFKYVATTTRTDNYQDHFKVTRLSQRITAPQIATSKIILHHQSHLWSTHQYRKNGSVYFASRCIRSWIRYQVPFQQDPTQACRLLPSRIRFLRCGLGWPRTRASQRSSALLGGSGEEEDCSQRTANGVDTVLDNNDNLCMN